MNIVINGEVIDPIALRKLGLAIVTASNAVIRQRKQLAQWEANPTDKERAEADRAATRVLKTAEKVQAMFNDLMKVNIGSKQA
jgi:hypothetical protein